jgi:hypothetical protein
VQMVIAGWMLFRAWLAWRQAMQTLRLA